MLDGYRWQRALGLCLMVGLTATVAQADRDKDRGHGHRERRVSRHRDHGRDDRVKRPVVRVERRVVVRERAVPVGRRITAPARLINGYTYVPLRAPFEQMGYDVNWDPYAQQALIGSGPRTVIVTPGSSTVIVVENGVQTPVYWDAPPVYYGSQMYVPLRPVGSGLGLQVSWDNGLVSLGNGFSLALW